MPASSQSRRPLVSYERTFFVPVVTISVRRSFCQTNGVAQFDASPSAVRPPHLRAGARVEGGDERTVFVVVHDVDTAVVKHRRRRRAPARAHSRRVHRFRPHGVPRMSNA
jgi:hypothetical protein